jgi:hypothetical protein
MYKKHHKRNRLAIEIIIILIVKIMLLWLLWSMFFSHPVPKENRQSEVTKIIMNRSN